MSNNTHNGIFLVKANRTVEEYANNKGGGGGGSTIIQIPIPAVQTYTYNGTEQTFAFTSAIDSSLVTLSGNKQTNAGVYTVTATLVNASDVWSDLTNAPKTFTWTINKTQGSFDLTEDSVVVNVENPSAVVGIINVVGDAAPSFSAVSADPSVADVTYFSPSAGVYALQIVAVGNGSTTITVTMAESSNYLGASDTISASSSANITVALTVNGAMSDNIFMYNVGDTPGVDTPLYSWILNGTTSGTENVTIPANGGTYLFVSTVAKALDGSNNNYSKTVTLTNSLSQSVSVMPDEVSYWFGNSIDMMVANSWSTEWNILPPTYSTNYMEGQRGSTSGYDSTFVRTSSHSIDVTNLVAMKALVEITYLAPNYIASGRPAEIYINTTPDTDQNVTAKANAVATLNVKQIVSLDISSLSGNYYDLVKLSQSQEVNTKTAFQTRLYALWFE